MDEGQVGDLEQLRIVTRRLLDRLGDALGANGPEQLEGNAAWYDRLYGAKSTLSATLLTVAELLLKLEAIQPADTAQAGTPVSEEDERILRHFIERARESDGD